MFDFFSFYKLFKNNNAFYIHGIYYSYEWLGRVVSVISDELLKVNSTSDNIGLIVQDNIDTYCSLLAILHSGYGYVPINPGNPQERNLNIINQAKIEVIIINGNCLVPNYLINIGCKVISIDIQSIFNGIEYREPISVSNNKNAYVLFTSGSTGIPKGVPISRGNLFSFLDTFNELFPTIDSNDRFLQMYDLTFDASVMHIFPALIHGACIYTIKNKGIKYLEAIRALQDYNITFALLMPSMLSYLHNYFDSINLPNLHYSLFGGEAVPSHLINEWCLCVPNAELFNAYGPTEATVFFMVHKMDKNKILEEAYNNIIYIGKPVKNATILLLDDEGNYVNNNSMAELCVSSPQLTKGYLNQSLNYKSFFIGTVEGKEKVFYKTGDIVCKNNEGIYSYINRKDNQVQIDGHRIELGEIENTAQLFFKKSIVAVAITYENTAEVIRIALFIVNEAFDSSALKQFCFSNLPSYMVPDKFIRIDELPLTVNGKTDRDKLSEFALLK